VNLPARGRGAGKLILLGEHAVLYGRPALAAGLGLGLEVEVRVADGAPQLESDRPEIADDPRTTRLLEQAAAMLGLDPWGLLVHVRSELPPGGGLGASAALAIAVLRALAAASGRKLGLDVEFVLGRRLEGIFHRCPSGLAPAAAALGSCFRFVRGEPPSITRLRAARPLPMVLALPAGSPGVSPTADALRARWDRERARYERLFDDVAVVVEEGARTAELGDLDGLGRAFDRNQDLLRALGMTLPENEGLVAVVKAAGALGAKLSGSAGDAVLALAPEPNRVVGALRARGIATLVVQTGSA